LRQIARPRAAAGGFWHEKHSSGDLPIPREGCEVSLALKR